MTDPLYELLTPYFSPPPSARPLPHPHSTTTTKYLSRLTTLPLSSLSTDEPTSLTQSTHSTHLSLQSLSARSATALVASSSHLSSLRSTLPQLAKEADALRQGIPRLDSAAVGFSEQYSRAQGENALLDRRKRALLLSRNVERLSDVLDLPMLLASAIASSSSSSSATATAATAQGAGTGNTTGTIPPPPAVPTTASSSYASALDLHSHIKRLHLLYPDSPLIDSIYAQTEEAMREMTSNLILSLRGQNIKLAAGMRTIGWLRRVAPELDGSAGTGFGTRTGPGGGGGNSEGSLGALFLVCRLGTLMTMLEALAPLRDLADQETEIRLRDPKTGRVSKDAWAGGQQTERYLKRFIEIFREQSFAIVSMYRSIFPSVADASSTATGLGTEELASKLKSLGLKSTSMATRTSNGGATQGKGQQEQEPAEDPLNPIPSALATFPMHLVNLLVETLRTYLPNVRDKSSRESLLTQVLYCAGSLGRLGGDFGVLLADLGAEDGDDGQDREGEREDAEWVAVMKKHRVLAGKLERMASGAS